MSRFLTAIGATALLALGACGGGESANQAGADNAVASGGTENVTIPPDETSGAATGDTLGSQLNALETENALGNQISDNGAADSAAGGNALDNASLNAAGNTQ